MKRLSQDKYSIDYRFFDSWTEQSSYLIGFILADGYIKYENGKRNENSLQIELSEIDQYFLINIKKLLKYEGPVRKTKRGTAVLHIANKRIIQQLIEKGVPAEDKTASVIWPSGIPEEFFPHFIRGVFDGDGSVYLDGYLRFQILGTKNLLENIKMRIPFSSDRNKIRYRGDTGSDIYCLRISGKKAEELCNWIYNDATIFLERKRNKFHEICGRIKTP